MTACNVGAGRACAPTGWTVTRTSLDSTPLGRRTTPRSTAARLTGVPVERVVLGAYMVCGLMAGIAAVLMVGWLGAVTNALGQTYELRVIAASVIGGANLMGGQGGAYGALIGAALIEVIRNSLLLSGVDPYWQGTFVGGFIILAVLLERARRSVP